MAIARRHRKARKKGTPSAPCSAPPARCQRDRCRARPERPRQARARRLTRRSSKPCRIMLARHRAPAPALPPQTTRTTAIAWQSACESDKDELSQPWCCARSASAPLRRSRAADRPVLPRSRAGKRHVGFCECLDHCFLCREPGRQSLNPVAALAVIDSLAVKNLAQVPVPKRRKGVLDILDGHDIAADADAVPVNLARQGDHALAVIVALLRESTDVLLLSGTWHHASDLTRLSTTCPMLCMEAKVDFLSTSSGTRCRIRLQAQA